MTVLYPVGHNQAEAKNDLFFAASDPYEYKWDSL
jgi:hypothetical protein